MKRREKGKLSVENILSASFSVIAEKSLAGTSMSLIARKAGVSKTLLHYHFKSKDAILDVVLDRVLERLLEIPLDNPAIGTPPSADDEIRGIFRRYGRIIAEEPDLLVVFYDFWVQGVKAAEIRQKIIRRFDAFRGYISQIVREGVEREEFSPEKSHMVAPLMLSLLEGASLQMISDPKAFNYELYQYMALDMIATLTGKGNRQTPP